MGVTFEGYSEIGKEEIEEALDFCCEQILHVLPEFTEKFQNAYSENGFYPPVENRERSGWPMSTAGMRG